MERFIEEMIRREEERQKNTVELIASENFVSERVLNALGSCLTNKYSEGYPAVRETGRTGRYYGGCQYVDAIEEYCCKVYKDVFRAPNYHVNVQPHSGSQANAAAYAAVLNPGDTILSMSLADGGHLSHGSPVNFSGKLYNVVFYNTDENGLIDYEDIRNKVRLFHPKLVLAGASAYPRVINFRQINYILQTARATDPYYKENPLFFMVDMAHIAGLVATGNHPSPFDFADIITTTTHKTLRGPRGGMIFCKPELAKVVDGAVFPGTQGGPLQNVIAAKAVAAEEALTPGYAKYIADVVNNARLMAERFKTLGYDVVTGGTDNHLFILDFSKTHPNITGLQVQEALDKVGITLNKNCVPGEKRSPKETSGVRIGTAAETTKGRTARGFLTVADKIDSVIKNL